MDTHARTIAKTITFRVVATIATMLLVLLFTGDWALVGAVGVLDALSKLFIYYAHERAWENVSWGKKKSSENSLK